MRDKRSFTLSQNGPSDADLIAIEREWPVIEAELALLDEQINALFDATVRGGAERLRRAHRRVLAAQLEVALAALDAADAQRSATARPWHAAGMPRFLPVAEVAA